jgi:hypothetical protein
MRRVGSWGLTAALIVGLGGAVVTAGGPDSDAKAPPKGIFSSWFGDKPKPPAKTDKKPVEVKPDMMPNAPDLTAGEQKRQMEAFMRRMAVCDRLRQVALQSDNEALMRQADELEMRAQELYRQKIANLPQVAAPLTTLAAEGEQKMTNRSLKQNKDQQMSQTLPPSKLPASKQLNVYDTPERLGGSFAEREQAALGGTGMGRDKP